MANLWIKTIKAILQENKTNAFLQKSKEKLESYMKLYELKEVIDFGLRREIAVKEAEALFGFRNYLLRMHNDIVDAMYEPKANWIELIDALMYN